MNVQFPKVITGRGHIGEILKINIIGFIGTAFIPNFIRHNFIPAAKSPLLKNFILIMDVKISGTLEMIYIA